MRIRVAVIVALLAVSCAEGAPAAEQLRPLVTGWEQHFTITWQASERGGRPVVSGYVLSSSGFAATRVLLLIEGLDGSGRVVDQRVEWLGTELMPGARVYFEVALPRASASYRVSMFSYDWVQTASLGVQTP